MFRFKKWVIESGIISSNKYICLLQKLYASKTQFKKYIIDFNSVREYLDKHNLLDRIENIEKSKVENYKTYRFTEDENEDKEDKENKLII